MKSLYESIMQSRFQAHKIEESIMQSRFPTHKIEESILSKSGIGMEVQIKSWFSDLFEHTSKGNYDVANNMKVKFEKGGAVIILHNYLSGYMMVEGRFLKGGDFPFKLDKIVDETGKEIRLVLKECSISSFKNFPNHNSIKFLGCAIEDLSGLPKSYNEIEFKHSHSLSGGRSCYIGKCQGLKLDLWSAEGDSYSMVINRFKNNTIKDFCLSSVGWSAAAASSIVTQIIDNNHIKPEDITVMFYNSDRHVKVNKGRVEKTKNGYVIIRDAKRHPEISNGYFG